MECNMCPMPALLGYPWLMPFMRGTLLRPKLQQRVCGKSAGNIASDLGCCKALGACRILALRRGAQEQGGPARP
eukprot:1159558-Pelagomonas_calceolata.AAC.6